MGDGDGEGGKPQHKKHTKVFSLLSLCCTLTKLQNGNESPRDETRRIEATEEDKAQRMGGAREGGKYMVEREPGKQMEHLEKHTENAAKCAVGNV